MANGHWVKWRLLSSGLMVSKDGMDTEVCPKCGTPKLVAMEGTTEDLGPA